MQWLIDSVDWIMNFIQTIWDIITGIFDNLLMLTTYVGLVAELAYNLIASLPSWIQAFGTLTIVVSILYIILGRQTGGSKE